MLDLVCQRYPNRRPSEYLDIEDDYTALQVDFAIAFKHHSADLKYDSDKVEAVINAMKPIGQALGVKYTEKKAPEVDSKIMPQGLPVETVLAMLRGKGTKVIRHE